jgi:tetratricopeptide (TPR) repeat protein
MSPLECRAMGKLLQVGFLAGIALASTFPERAQAASWDFVPTPVEWQVWPEYCRAQYTILGEAVPYDGYQQARATAQQWRASIGARTYDGMHHYCAALHFRTRALAEAAPMERAIIFRRAWEDAEYSYVRTDPASMVYPAISVGVARVRFDMGKPDEAVQILKRSIEARPDALDAYVQLAVIYRRQKQLQDALTIMEKAESLQGGQSSEVQYILGLIYLDMGNLDAAERNAKLAYAKGYPLPGLRDRLREQGRSIPPGGGETVPAQ